MTKYNKVGLQKAETEAEDVGVGSRYKSIYRKRIL